MKLGLGIVHAEVKLGALSASETEAKFQGHVHLGAFLGENHNFFFDARLGILSDTFLLSPTIGYLF